MADIADKITAFMIVDHVEGEDGALSHFASGQRVDLAPELFEDWEKRSLCVKGVRAEMVVGVEGGKYSLKAHDKVWLSPDAFQAWKDRGICKPAFGDPTFDEMVKDALDVEQASQEALQAANGQIDELNKGVAKLGAEIAELRLLTDAIVDQVRRTTPAIALAFEDAKKLDLAELEIGKLMKMLPDELPAVPTGKSKAKAKAG